MTIDQIKRALKAKMKDKSNLPKWAMDRFEICSGCDFNSGNKDKLSFKDRLRLSHNFGKDACLKCTCGITDKISDPIEQCPLTPPKWKAQIVVGATVLKLINKTPHKVTQKNNTEFDYGTIKKGSNTEIKVKLEVENEIKDFNLTSSCGCTVPSKEKVDGGYMLKIKYDSNRMGSFQKNVSIKDGKKVLGKIIIKGKVE